jgi:hypothetical protein
MPYSTSLAKVCEAIRPVLRKAFFQDPNQTEAAAYALIGRIDLHGSKPQEFSPPRARQHYVLARVTFSPAPSTTDR